jgi:signal transduction histidine kinase
MEWGIVLKNKISIRRHLTLIFGVFSLLITLIVAITFNFAVANSFDKYATAKNQQQPKLIQMPDKEESNYNEFLSVIPKTMTNEKVVGLGNTSSRMYQLNSIEQELKDSINRSIIISGAISFFISILVGYFISRKLSKPLKALIGVTKQIEKGNYSIKVDKTSKIEEIYLLGISLEKMAQKIDENIEHDKRVSQDVQHEIRTPLTNIKVQIEAMIDGIWQLNTENITLCLNEVNRLSAIANQLYQLGNIENTSDSIVYSTFLLPTMVDSIKKEFEISLKAKNMEVINTIDCDISITSDENLLRSAIYNLISNSVRYSGESSTIKVNYKKYISNDINSNYFSTIQKKADILKNYNLISIEDNGVGIADDKLQVIFERFYRIDKSRARKLGGSGLGLSIVNAIVLKLGGFVDVKSIETVKTTFTIFLPQ